jgi:hypothetical protein
MIILPDIILGIVFFRLCLVLLEKSVKVHIRLLLVWLLLGFQLFLIGSPIGRISGIVGDFLYAIAS